MCWDTLMWKMLRHSKSQSYFRFAFGQEVQLYLTNIIVLVFKTIEQQFKATKMSQKFSCVSHHRTKNKKKVQTTKNILSVDRTI